MNIKEMEQRSSMTRANIRFYEQEGLLSPRRQDNGYRDYSEDDLRQLHRIHLLRTLGVSLEEIRAAQKGELALDTLLETRAAALEQQAADAQQRAQLCRRIRQDGAQYSTLDGQHYLNALTAAEPAAAAVPREDSYHKVTAPWRRFFARHFDLFLYTTLWSLLGILLLGLSPSSETGSSWFGAGGLVSVVMMVLLEPLLLATWGTTPGKWLLGLRVRNNTGQKLSYGEGSYRTLQALWYGAGMFIPIFELFRGYKYYYDCTEGKTLPWEWDSELHLKDEKPTRAFALMGCAAAAVGLLALALALSSTPRQRGDMTVDEFARSYNRLAKYHGIEVRLDEDGGWEDEIQRPDGGVTIYLHDQEIPDFDYTVENGVITGISFTIHKEGDSENWVSINQNRRALAILAYVQAYDPTPLNNSEAMAVIDRLESDPFSTFVETVHGVRITWDFSSSGYHRVDNGGLLVPIEGQTPSCTMRFTLQKVS